MTKQEIFNTVWNWFVVERHGPSVDRQSADLKTRCRYRGPNGTKCAAGILIPDTNYREEMEGLGFYSVNRNFKLGFGQVESNFIANLQNLHDGAASDYSPEGFFEAMKIRLQSFAQVNELEIP